MFSAASQSCLIALFVMFGATFALDLSSNSLSRCTVKVRNCQAKCKRPGSVIAVKWSIDILTGTVTCFEKMSDVPVATNIVETITTTTFEVRCCEDLRELPKERSNNQGCPNCTQEMANMTTRLEGMTKELEDMTRGVGNMAKLLAQQNSMEKTSRIENKKSAAKLSNTAQLTSVIAGSTLAWVIVGCVLIILYMFSQHTSCRTKKTEKAKPQPKSRKYHEKNASSVVTVMDSETKTDSDAYISPSPNFKKREPPSNRNQNSAVARTSPQTTFAATTGQNAMKLGHEGKEIDV